MGGSAFIWAMGFLISLGVPDWYMDEALCLVEAVHYEANGESRAGKRGIANVMTTRAEHERFPVTYCGVLDAPGAFDHRRKDLMLQDVILTEPGDVASFEVTLDIVRITLNGDLIDNTGGATHFYNPHLSNPFWATPERLTSRIGLHQYVNVYP